MNLIITCSRHLEEEASNEISGILQELGDDFPKIEITSFSGIISVNTTINPITVIQEIRKMILDEPWRFRYCHRFIPIQESTTSTIDNIVSSVKNQTKLFNDTETYRITIEKRGSELSSKELIDAIAKNVPNKVSLESFDWNIIVQVIGRMTGISVLKEDNIISTLKLKRDSME